MRIAIFGATGRTGRHVVVEALTRGHSVVGISRHPPDDAPEHPAPRIPWHTADVLDPVAVRAALVGADAVVVCIGSVSVSDTSCGQGTKNIVDAMRELGIPRLACQTGAMIGHDPSRLGWILRGIRTTWRTRCEGQARDRDAQESCMRSSGLLTTVVRPTRLVDGEKTSALRATDAFVSSLAASRYEDVAAALIDGVEGRLDPMGRDDPVKGVVVLSRPALDVRFVAKWIAAHAAGEMLGLAVVGIAAMLARSWAHGSVAAALALGASAGVLEGAIVGGLLGTVIVAARPEVRLSAWLRWTMVGAVICWGFGMLPSALVHATQGGAGVATHSNEPPRWLISLGAVGLGLLAGPILGALQARALRPMGVRARTWIAATSIGWAAGMPIVFAAASESWSGVHAAVRGLALLACAGAVVGLATGVALRSADRFALRGATRPTSRAAPRSHEWAATSTA